MYAVKNTFVFYHRSKMNISATPVRDFYRNKTVFITGGSGSIGKVLIEKLLRSCPDLKRIYLLMRSKKGKTPEDRVKAITEEPLFDLLRPSPEVFDKLSIVTGDCAELGLGLSSEDKQRLVEEVNVIFHSAASVRFDDPLDTAIILNTRGTREIANLATEMQQLQFFLHVSTAYCNCDKKVVEERLYPAHMDWRKAINLAEKCDRNTINVLTSHFISPMPNTYTFAKSLSEHVVHEICTTANIPLVIYRPSIVVSTWNDPFPGWVDSFNGLMGILAGCASGTVLTFYAPSDNATDNIPMDFVVKGMITSVWKQSSSTNPVVFYNASNNDICSVKIQEIYQAGARNVKIYPLDNTVLPPKGSSSNWFYLYYFETLLYQLLPAIIIDFSRKITQKKPFLINIQRRVYVANVVLHFFAVNSWSFLNEKFVKLGTDQSLSKDLDEFGFEWNDSVDIQEFMLQSLLGIRRYLFKQKDEDLPEARKRQKRLYIFVDVVRIVFYAVLAWILYKFVFARIFITQ